VVLFAALGFFTIPIFPISLELGVESTFPVAEATSSGILIISGLVNLTKNYFTILYLGNFNYSFSLLECNRWNRWIGFTARKGIINVSVLSNNPIKILI
jgi:hypothetical protein